MRYPDRVRGPSQLPYEEFMSDLIQHVNEDSFEPSVLKSDVPVLVDYWAEWCGPCKAIAPVLTEIAKEQAGNVTIAKLNVDDHGDIAQRFGVMSIPTLLVFKNGELKKKLVGAKGKTQLLEEIEEFIQKKS